MGGKYWVQAVVEGGGAMAVAENLVAEGFVFGDEDAVVAGDDGGAFLERGDPVDLAVGDGAVGQLAEGCEEVFVGGDRCGRRCERQSRCRWCR
ncbi:hypothetical protein ACF08M_39500 [Streptomyces sp. NPDC015032]|uniref:hypothetical protein n=1 Tax=Streptomyces sp. NPDC015032 TaxID=3364937 RepID=UPI0036FEFC3C